jgi:hypothetical protein
MLSKMVTYYKMANSAVCADREKALHSIQWHGMAWHNMLPESPAAEEVCKLRCNTVKNKIVRSINRS